MVQGPVVADDGPRRVWRDDHPGGLVPTLLERTPKADEPAPLEQLAVLLVERDLGHDGRAISRRQVRRIQFVPEGPEERNGGPRLDRGHPIGLMVRDGGDVRTDGTHRVRHGAPPLDRQTFDGIGVVARPGLRGESEHARIEPTAAARARLEQDLRERGSQASVEVIHTEDVAVEELALTIGREGQAERLRERPVHVPLDVRDRRAAEHLGQDLEQVINDLRS